MMKNTIAFPAKLKSFMFYGACSAFEDFTFAQSGHDGACDENDPQGRSDNNKSIHSWPTVSQLSDAASIKLLRESVKRTLTS